MYTCIRDLMTYSPIVVGQIPVMVVAFKANFFGGLFDEDELSKHLTPQFYKLC